MQRLIINSGHVQYIGLEESRKRVLVLPIILVLSYIVLELARQFYGSARPTFSSE